MKILYVGNDSHDAEVTAFALQSIAPGVTVAWIPSLKEARGWIEQNRDVAVLAVEVNPDPAACGLFIGQIRAVGVTAPLVLVAGGAVQAAPPALEKLADATIPKTASLLHDLPKTIVRVLKDRASKAPMEPPAAPAEPPPASPARAVPQPVLAHTPTQTPRVNPFAQLVPGPDAAAQQLKQALASLEQARQDRETLAAINAKLERQVADATVALERAESRHAEDMRDAAARLGDERARSNERSSKANAALDTLRAQLVEQAAALHKAEQQAAVDRHAAAEDAARRQAKAESDLTQETSTRQAAERATAAAEAARAAAEGRHASALDALKTELADRNQQFDQRLAEAATRLDEQQRQATERAAQAAAALDALQAKLVEARDALQQAEARESTLTRELAEAEACLVEVQRDAEAQLTQAAADAKAREADAERRLAEAGQRQEALTNELAEADARLVETAAAAKAREARLETSLREESARRETSDNELVQARAAADQAQRRFVEASNDMRERSREHAASLEERTARERAEWETTLAERQERVAQLQRDGDLVRQSLASREVDLKRLQAAHEEQRGRFDRTRAASDAELARVREECAALQGTLEDHRRQLDVSPISLCRCAPDGTVTQASRGLAKLLGYASAEQIVSGGVAVFDSRDDLQWLIDRCGSSRSPQSIETTWRKKDGSRIVVRLVAAASSAGSIDLAAEDITTVKALEEKLRHAQRLEAVARYASEVAATCENLLRAVTQTGPQWLSLIENDSTRHEGERLLADVIRVSGFLRQLAEYGGKQKQALPLVDVNSVLHDLASVLKRVAGDHIEIELVLPKSSKPLNLDVETEHVERIFVNIAAYARARMPLGGRLLIDVAPALLDREFTERYPSVRPGDHVLFTVTEVKGPALSTPATVFGLHGANGTNGSTKNDTPGVDLGMLQSLVANCGGHLWISAEPSGDMVLKVHLPRRALDDRAATTGPARWISRLAGAARH